jgi:hypothetical protein
MTRLAAGNSQFSYYKLPALQDKRIGKSKTYITKPRRYAWLSKSFLKITYLLHIREFAILYPHLA